MIDMHGEKRGEFLVVTLTNEECLRVKDGDILGDRVNPVYPDAKIEVRKLSDYYEVPDGDIDRGHVAEQAIAEVFGNEDMCLYVPDECVETVFYPSVTIPPERIISPMANPEYVEHYKSHVSPAGIKVVFEGSLVVVDMTAAY